MYRFGEWIDDPVTDLMAVVHAGRERLARRPACSVDDRLRIFEALAVLWVPQGEFFERALARPNGSSTASACGPGPALDALHRLIAPRYWRRRLGNELPDPMILEGSAAVGTDVIRAYPLGVVWWDGCNSTNFLDFLDGLLAPLLTGNAPILFIPPDWRALASLILESLVRCDGQSLISQNATVFCQTPAPDNLTGIDGAPPMRIRREPASLVGVMSSAFWYSSDPGAVIARLSNEATDMAAFHTSRLRTVFVEEGLQHQLTELGAGFPMPEIKPYVDLGELVGQLKRLSDPATGCIYGLSGRERGDYVEAASRLGIRRFAPFDGFYEQPDMRVSSGLVLRDLLVITTDERGKGLGEFLRDTAEYVPYYHARRPLGDPTVLERWPMITGADLASEPLHESRAFLHEQVRAGSIFSSGGTAAAPKYALYAPDEARHSAHLLAHGFRAAGLSPGDRVINLFIAGHLWSAFIAVEEALSTCGVYALPMGGLAPIGDIVTCLTAFKPNVAIGLPSLLVGYARHCESAGIDVSIEKIFYAGEHFNASARQYVSRIWHTRSFHSAGYAAVDVGPIGWQCAHSQGGEHHLFDEDVHMEIVDEEAVVTSLLRRAMPVVRYRTGDRVERVHEACACGNTSPRFRLLGRIDTLMNIWGCRLAYEDVERALMASGLEAPVLQLLLREADDPDARMEQLILRLEQTDPGPEFFERLMANLHRYSRDLGVALVPSDLAGRVKLEWLPPGSLPRIERTGKIRLIVDERGAARP